MPTSLYFSGTHADVLVYVNQRGEHLAADFVDQLGSSDQKKIVRLVQEFANRGEIRNEEKFRLEEKPIYVFKSFQIRILCFYLPGSPKRTIVLTHGFLKMSDKLPQSQLKRALAIYQEITKTRTQPR